MLEKIEVYVRKCFWGPFLIGFIGYFFLDGGSNGESLNLLEAFYASAALYFVNPVSNNSNVCIMIAKIMALVVTADFILSVISSSLDSMSHWFAKMNKDSTAIYTDTELGEKIVLTAKHAYVSKSGKVEDTNDHIIMFNDDAANLCFYENNREFFSKPDRRVFIGLNHIDSALLSSSKDSNVRYFCLDEIRARSYWRTYNLYNALNKDKAFKIAIVGWNAIGKSIFKQGYLNNIYEINQTIEYHIWECDSYEKQFLENLKFENNDKVMVHTLNYKEEWDQIIDMDRIIIAKDEPIEMVQDLIRTNGRYKIYCSMEGNQDLSVIFNSNKIYMFGNLEKLLTIDNIKSERIYLQAKLVNYDYDLRCEDKKKKGEQKYKDCLPDKYEEKMEESWSKLDGFLKGSNMARADYYWIEKKNLDKNISENERCKLEHIRWCRYYYYNGWKYATGNKDNLNRTHPDLVVYEDLPQDEKKKDGIYNSEIEKKLGELDGRI